jgi:hypothetical protein
MLFDEDRSVLTPMRDVPVLQGGIYATIHGEDRFVPFSNEWTSERSPMTNDTAAQLAILTDALTEIVDLTTVQPTSAALSDDLFDRMGEIAAGALIAAATYGQLPPFPTEIGLRGDTLN